MDAIVYEPPKWWRPNYITVVVSTFKYMIENEKTFSGDELNRLKDWIVKNRYFNRLPQDYGMFWDPAFKMDTNPLGVYLDMFRSFDIGFLRAKANEKDPSLKDPLCQGGYFSDYKIPRAMCPYCIDKRRRYKIVMDNFLETARCASCGITDYIYAFTKKLPDYVRADAEKELVRIFKAAENSRKEPLDALDKEIKDDMEALRKQTGVILCVESQIHSEEEKRNLPQPLVGCILPSKTRRFP